MIIVFPIYLIIPGVIGQIQPIDYPLLFQHAQVFVNGSNTDPRVFFLNLLVNLAGTHMTVFFTQDSV